MIEFISQLPTEYQEVEYIESSGTQYIDTGVIPTVATGVKVRGHYVSLQNADNIILGASDQTAFANGKPYAVDSYPDKVFFPFGGFANDATDTITISQTKNKQYEYTLNYKNSGIATVETQQLTLPTRSSMTSKAIYLFCLNGNGTAGYYSSFALEYLQITQGEDVIHDYVPCYRKADNVAGLYDLVTGAFYTNSGSGAFAVGKDSTKRGTWIIAAGGSVPIQYALRRRMIGKKRIPKWTLSIAKIATGTSAKINGEKLSADTYVVDDGTIVTFTAVDLTRKGRIMVDGVTVAVGSSSAETVKYELEVHANYSATTSQSLYYLSWEITTQQ